MTLDPRTKLLILSITSVSVFLNKSIVIECFFMAIPALLLLRERKLRTALEYMVLFVVLLMIQLFLILKLPITVGGVIYMFDVYIRKLIPCFMLGAFLIYTTKVSTVIRSWLPSQTTDAFPSSKISATIPVAANWTPAHWQRQVR